MRSAKSHFTVTSAFVAGGIQFSVRAFDLSVSPHPILLFSSHNCECPAVKFPLHLRNKTDGDGKRGREQDRQQDDYATGTGNLKHTFLFLSPLFFVASPD
jgi:hypothetical protein